MPYRTVQLQINLECQAAVHDRQADIEFQKAIGYLSMWANGSERYLWLRLTGDSEGNLDAAYYNGDPQKEGTALTYTIGAILREDNTYSFHS